MVGTIPQILLSYFFLTAFLQIHMVDQDCLPVSPILAQCSICFGVARLRALAIIVALSNNFWFNLMLTVAITSLL
jgi:hypothetical protein